MGKTRRPTDYTAHGAFDSHAHLERAVYAGEVEAVLDRAWTHGLGGIILVAAADYPEVYDETLALAALDSRLAAVAGIHPHYARHAPVLRPALERALATGSVAALGEFGLDFHYDLSPREEQRSVMRWQMALAAELDLPKVLHVREAFEESLAILDEFGSTHDGVVHCFSGTAEEAREYVARGLHLSIPGIVTFGNKAGELREAVAETPLDRLLVETDSPYLAPHPFRGRRNEPALVAFVVEEVARCKGLSPEEVARATTENVRRLFRLG
jgi:TatD DNase family protein